MTDTFEQRHLANGFPWCDTCRQPAVYSEFFGLRHATQEHPGGQPASADGTGHEVTIRKWSTGEESMSACRCTIGFRCDHHRKLDAELRAELAEARRSFEAELATLEKSRDFHVPEPELATSNCVCGCHREVHEEYDPTSCFGGCGCERYAPAVPVDQARRFAASELRRLVGLVISDDTKHDVLEAAQTRATQLEGQ